MINKLNRENEVPLVNGTEKRFDTSGQATAALIGSLQQRNTSNGEVRNESDK